MINSDTYFKYRSLRDWRHVLDIFLNKRLHAAKFKQMNDPMEGRYFYYKDEVTDALVKAIGKQKDEWKICSMSRDPFNTLMWSYYADGHRGIAVGVKLPPVGNNHCEVRDVTYPAEVRLDSSRINDTADKVALHILAQKQKAWTHEAEVRVFSRSDFIQVDIEHVYLGCNIGSADRELITALVQNTAPSAEVRRVERSQLDQPLDRFWAAQ